MTQKIINAQQEIITNIENPQLHKFGMELDQVIQYEIGVGEYTIWRGRSYIDVPEWISVKNVSILIIMTTNVLGILLHVVGIIHTQKLTRKDYDITMMRILKVRHSLKQYHLNVVNIP